MELPANITVEQRQKMCSSLISNIMSKTYIEGLRNRVHELNKQFLIKKSIKLDLEIITAIGEVVVQTKI